MTTPLPSLSWLRSALLITGRRLGRGPLHPGWSWRMETLTEARRTRQMAAAPGDLRAGRERLAELLPLPLLAPAVRVEPARFGGRRAFWLWPRRAAARLILYYLPGGSYTAASPDSTRLAALLAESAQARALLLEYSLAPESPFPAALEDALEGYRWLLNHGVDPGQIVFAGDGSGGGLALAALLSLRYHKLPTPGLAVLFSPWVDLSATGGSLESNARYDWLDPAALAWGASQYVRGSDPRTPLISPRWASLTGLPPLYIQAGKAEILWDQILELGRQAVAAGCSVQIDAWEGMNHTFQMAGSYLPQSQEALARARIMIEQRLHVERPTIKS